MATDSHDEEALTEEGQVWALLDRYLSGECTAAQAALVEAWASRPDNARMLADIRRLWTEAERAVPSIDEEGELLALRARIAAHDRQRTPLRLAPVTVPAAQRSWFPPVAVAAAAIAGIVLWRTGMIERVTEGPPAPEKTYTTARAQRAEILLSDGTQVWLNVESRLSTEAGYGSRHREVRLEGEGFFVVRHDPKRPFRVHARDGVTQVLGTEFGVRTYRDDAGAMVMVSAGRVSLRPPAQQSQARPDTGVLLTRGDVGRFGPDGRIHIQRGVDVSSLFAWRDGNLRFTGAPLRTVIRDLERWYDLEIDVADSALLATPVTASFVNATAEQALMIIARTLDVSCHRDGRQVRLADAASTRAACAPAMTPNTGVRTPTIR